MTPQGIKEIKKDQDIYSKVSDLKSIILKFVGDARPQLVRISGMLEVNDFAASSPAADLAGRISVANMR